MIRGIIITAGIIFAFLIFTAPVFYAFLGYPVFVSGKDMAPNFNNGDFIMLDKFTYKEQDPKRGDLVIYKNEIGQILVKRIVGMPGEQISFLNGGVYINNSPLDESYLSKDTITRIGGDVREGENVEIPEGSFYVLNDDRSRSSTDSRKSGSIKKTSILGKYWFKVY